MQSLAQNKLDRSLNCDVCAGKKHAIQGCEPRDKVQTLLDKLKPMLSHSIKDQALFMDKDPLETDFNLDDYKLTSESVLKLLPFKAAFQQGIFSKLNEDGGLEWCVAEPASLLH